MTLALVLVWLAVVDGGAPAAPKPHTAEDLEVIRNLGLLEDLESATELEALEELSLER